MGLICSPAAGRLPFPGGAASAAPAWASVASRCGLDWCAKIRPAHCAPLRMDDPDPDDGMAGPRPPRPGRPCQGLMAGDAARWRGREPPPEAPRLVLRLT